MPAPDLTERATRAAAEVAEEAGLRFGRPTILQDRSNLIVHLAPAPVVARVATTTGLVRRGDAWLAREVAVAGHLARAGAPVVAPSDRLPPGPHLRDGLALSFWEYADELAAPPDARRAGAGLRVCHEALMTLPGDLFPPMAVLGEARAIVERLARDGTLGASDAAALRQAGTGVTLRLDELAPPMQPVHGDVHLGNVIHTTAGPLWNDWEDTFAGPREWDLACLEASARIFGSDPAAVAEARAGHGEEADAEVLALLLEARRFQGTVWMVLSARGRPEMRSRAADLLARFPRAS